MIDRGFFLIDKEPGWTSHDVVAKLRGVVATKRVGHAGTLDPPATGLVVVAFGRATRLLRFVQDLEKVYVGRIGFGAATDTLDADGTVLERKPMPVAREEVAAALSGFVGRIDQVPPMVSAVKVQGRRLHELARAGLEVAREPRKVEIHEIDLVDFTGGDYPDATVRVRCGKGTYIRSLADDLGRALGGRAHLASLRRISIGSLDVGDAVTVPALAALPAPLKEAIAPAAALRDLASWRCDDATADRVAHGGRVTDGRFRALDGSAVAMLDGAGRLLAVYRVAGNLAVPEVVLT